MREFKIRDIEDANASFVVEIEFIDNGDRTRFVYPKNEGWELEYGNTEMPKFVWDITQRLENEEIACQSCNVTKISEMRTTLKNQVFKDVVRPTPVNPSDNDNNIRIIEPRE